MAQATAGVADAQGHDLKVTGLITCAHFFSHLYILALPPIFPVLRADLGLSVTELGLLLAALNVTTVLAQPPIGVLVDRYGPGLILIAGQIAFALGIGLAGLGTGLASFLPLMVLAGLGNAVYHPADYAILSARVSPGRTARAFSIHTFGGYAGFAAAPVVMVALTALVGWRMGLLLIGAAGLVMAAVLFAARGELAASVTRKKEQAAGGTLALLTSPAVLGGFAFFLLLALGHAGISGFSVVALTGLYGLGLAAANAPVTVFLTCGAIGVLAGGWVADRFGHHGLIVAICSLVLAAMAGVVALVTLPPPALLPLFAVGGLASGMVAPVARHDDPRHHPARRQRQGVRPRDGGLQCRRAGGPAALRPHRRPRLAGMGVRDRGHGQPRHRSHGLRQHGHKAGRQAARGCVSTKCLSTRRSLAAPRLSPRSRKAFSSSTMIRFSARSPLGVVHR